MATRLKTVEYWFPMIDTLADNAATAATQITVYIPEAAAGVVTFRSVYTDVVVADVYTTATNVTSRITTLTLQGASASTVTNSQTLTQSGENFTHFFSADFTAYFNANWGANASRTLDCSLTINTSPLGSRNASIRVVITYSFDDTQPAHLKTVWIPLNAPTGALPTTQSTVHDTIPNLSTYLPEQSVVIRQYTVVIQGNTESNSATDLTISFDCGDGTPYTSQLYEKGSNVDMWYRIAQPQDFSTNATQDFQMWASVADFDHPQAWLSVTYEFTVAGTTRILNSLLLPMEVAGAMGGNTSALYSRTKRDLFIEEPETITTLRVAALVFYSVAAAISSLNARVGTGSFVGYTSVATTLGGQCGFMVRNDSAFTLARGRNVISLDTYNTDTADCGFNTSCLWLINYTSDVPANGIWAANHTVIRNLMTVGTQSATAFNLSASDAPNIPETSYFLTGVGVAAMYTTSGTLTNGGLAVGAERLVAEGGFDWENVYESLGGTDPEVGIFYGYGTARSVFTRWPGDIEGGDRLNIETARRWRIIIGGQLAFTHLDLMLTYHSITFTVADSVSGSDAGTVDITLQRASSGEPVLATTRTGDGAFSFTWYDNTETMQVAADDGTNYGLSAPALASGSP
jgi:hypothetical protein